MYMVSVCELETEIRNLSQEKYGRSNAASGWRQQNKEENDNENEMSKE